MASLLSPRRTRGDIDLAATEPTVVLGAGERPELPTVAWLGLAAGAGVLSAVCGWVLVTGLVVLAWLAAEPGTLTQALGVGTQLWLLANGGGATLGAVSVTLIPWTLTLLVAWVISRTAGYAARLGPAGSPTVIPMVCIVATLGYLVPLLAVGLIAGGPMAALRAGTVMLVVVAASAAWGCCRARDTWPTDTWPAWSRAIPRAVAAALLLMVAGGAAVLATGLAVNRERLTAMIEALDAGLVGNVALLLGQLAYAPNAVVWAASYAIGPGFTLGNGSLVSPAATELGLLPSIPLLTAVPDVGPGGVSHLWWLALGVAAGAVAATLVVLARPTARFDETTLVGGLAGVLTGIAFTGLSWLTSGDLGSDLLSGLGPQLVPVLVMATSTLGLSGAICGLLLGLWRRPRRNRVERDADAADTGADDTDADIRTATEETQVLGHRDARTDRTSVDDPDDDPASDTDARGDELTAPITRRRAAPARPRAAASARTARSASTGRSATTAASPPSGADEPTQQIG